MTSHVIAYRSTEFLLGTHAFDFNCFLVDFNCLFMQICCLSVLLGCLQMSLEKGCKTETSWEINRLKELEV